MAQPRAMRAVTGVALLPYRVAYAPRPVSWRSPLGALSANLCAPRGPGGVHQPLWPDHGPGVRVVSQCSGDIISWPISTGVGLELKPCGEYQAVKASGAALLCSVGRAPCVPLRVPRERHRWTSAGALQCHHRRHPRSRCVQGGFGLRRRVASVSWARKREIFFRGPWRAGYIF